MYKSRRVLFSLFVNIPLTTARINFRISECHHRFSIDLIIIFSAKNGKLFLDHTDPLRGQGGVPWVQIMENEFDCLVVRGGDSGHFAEKFVKKYCS